MFKNLKKKTIFILKRKNKICRLHTLKLFIIFPQVSFELPHELHKKKYDFNKHFPNRGGGRRGRGG